MSARAPARTLSGRENQLVSAAIDLAEKQIREGTASSQVLTHFLKLGTVQHTLEQQKLENENLLIQAKVESIKQQESVGVIVTAALAAMKKYRGEDEDDEL